MTRGRARRMGPRGSKAPRYALLLAVVLIAGAYLFHLVAALRQPLPVGQFASLVDHRGQPFAGQAGSRGYKLVVFGYAHCPDVCPTSLLKVHEILAALEGDATRVVPLFVTVDPANDTPELLASFTAAFDPRILGITGDAADLRAFANAYGVLPSSPSMPGQVDMPGHSAMIYLLDPGNARIGVYNPTESTRAIAHDIRLRTGTTT